MRRNWGFLLLPLLLALGPACGGEGASVSLSTESLTFTAIRGGPVPPSQEIEVRIEGEYHDAVAGTLGEPPDWIDVSWGDPAEPVVVGVNTTDLEPGAHPVTVRIGTIRENNTGIAWADVSVTYNVLPAPF
jgi:hypothetical protein